MPRFSDRGDRGGRGGRGDRGDRFNSSTRLYVGQLSSRTRTHDLEDQFARYGRVRDVDMKRDYAFVEFSDPRDADDARHSMNGRDVDGSRITVEFARGGPRGPGGSRDMGGGRGGPPPGSGRCFNCGLDGHWARDCKAGDWKNKCYRCGDRGHIERNCQNSPKKLKGRSYSRSPSPRRRSPSPRRGRSRSRSLSRSRSRSYSPSRSPPKKDQAVERADRSRSPRASRSPKQQRGSPVSSRGRKRSPSPDERSPEGRGTPSPRYGRRADGSDYGNSPRPRTRSRSRSRSRSSIRSRSRSPLDEAEKDSPRNGDTRSPNEENGRDPSASPVAKNDRNGRGGDVDNDDYEASPRGSE